MGIQLTGRPVLPAARGPLTAGLISALRKAPGTPLDDLPSANQADADGGWDEDLQLALYLCYEQHYRGFEDVAAEWEWDPGLLAMRGDLEGRFLAAIRAELGPVPSVTDQLDELLLEPIDGAGVSHHLLDRGRAWQAREYLVHRSMYHLKEADPQAWAIPRVHGAAQAALVLIEFDEYGAGRPEQVHSRLFAEMMADLQLDPAYGRYLDNVTAESLAVVNLMSLFGLHRAHVGALLGQFARAEITSSPGSRRLAEALARLGAGPAGTRFYREHVEADAVHEQLVRREVIGSLIREEPRIEGEVAFGLAASGLVDDRLGAHILDSWREDRSSLRVPLADGPRPE